MQRGVRSIGSLCRCVLHLACCNTVLEAFQSSPFHRSGQSIWRFQSEKITIVSIRHPSVNHSHTLLSVSHRIWTLVSRAEDSSADRTMAQLSVQVPASCARHALPFSTSRQHGLLMPKTSISTAARSFMAFRSQQRRAQCLIIKAEGDGDGNSAPPAEVRRAPMGSPVGVNVCCCRAI